MDAGIDLFDCQAGQHPLIVREYLGGRVNIETLVILDKLTGFVNKFDEHLGTMMMWPETSRLLRKYRPFLRIELEQYKKIYEEKFN
jgi:hypothetical protein